MKIYFVQPFMLSFPKQLCTSSISKSPTFIHSKNTKDIALLPWQWQY